MKKYVTTDYQLTDNDTDYMQEILDEINTNLIAAASKGGCKDKSCGDKSCSDKPCSDKPCSDKPCSKESVDASCEYGKN